MAIAADDYLCGGRGGAWYGTAKGKGRTCDERNCMAMAPAREASQNNGCEAAATVVLVNRERRMRPGGADRRSGKSRITARATADTKPVVSERHQAAVMVKVRGS